MQAGQTIRDRYRLDDVIGRGAGGTTYLATDRKSGARVVVKAISLAGLGEWRDFDSLEREARVLAAIDHPRVPRYVDSFSLEAEEGPAYVLVQQYIAGSNLEQKVRDGWRGTEEEVCRIVRGLLGIVRDIHALRPPVIHRDICPRNVILGDDGEVYLVDFGGVLEMVKRERSAGMTVVGTAGFVPVEQWGGNATERSDLYACGATMLFLLTHQNPADLPLRDMRIYFRSVVEVTPAVGFVLDRLLEPDEARRTLEPAEAVRILETGKVPEREVVGDEPPYGSRIRVSRGADGLQLFVPERGDGRVGLAFAGFSVVWLAFVGFWTAMTFAMHAPVIFSLASLPFWVAGFAMLRKALRVFFGKVWVNVSSQGLRLRRRVLLAGRLVAVPLAALDSMEVKPSNAWQVNSQAARENPQNVVRIQAGAKAFSFGETLSEPERNWLCDTIRREVAILRG